MAYPSASSSKDHDDKIDQNEDENNGHPVDKDNDSDNEDHTSNKKKSVFSFFSYFRTKEFWIVLLLG